MKTRTTAEKAGKSSWLGWLSRLARHVWLDEEDARRAIPPSLSQALAQRIARSEVRHAGEIRVCVEASLPWQDLRRIGRTASAAEVIRQRAQTLFASLGVWDTEHNSGVLIYVLLAEHAIEIVADRGLRRIPPERWQAVADALAQAFRQREQADGLMRALDQVEALLAQSGLAADAVNELPDAPHLQ